MLKRRARIVTRIPLFAALFLCLLSCHEAQREQRLRIYYTASLNGNLDGCSCVSSPKSGLVKSAAFLRSRDRGGSLLLDAGDLLEVAPDAELARHLLDVYQELRYDAIAVGDQELSNGLEALRTYLARYPLEANNLSLTTGSGETPLRRSPRVIRRGSLLVNVISLVDPGVFALYPRQLKAQLSVTPPQAALASLLPRSGHRLTVLLYHGPVQAATSLVTRNPGVDLLIVGHAQELVEPQKFGDTIVASPGEQGNRVGIFTLKVKDGHIVEYAHEFRLFKYSSDPDDSSVRARIEQYRAALRSKVKRS